MMVALPEKHFFFQQLEHHCSVIMENKIYVLVVTVVLKLSKIADINVVPHLLSIHSRKILQLIILFQVIFSIVCNQL